MIPKKIHFCWLSGEEFPPFIQHCIDTWKLVLPDYELILWDTNRFDINRVAWVQEAFAAKKYAFAADYIRLYSVYTEGGIYLDSDVEVLKRFDDLLQYKSFIGFEAATESVEAAIFGAEVGCEWCKKAMEFYHDKHFCMDEYGGVKLDFIAPNIFRLALISVFQDFPLKIPANPILLQKNQDSIYVCPAEYFSPLKYDLEKSNGSENKLALKYRSNPNTYCIHCFTASWGVKVPMYIRVWDYLKRRFLKKFLKKI